MSRALWTQRAAAHTLNLECHNAVMDVLEPIRRLTRNTEYEGRIYVVGGALRDRVLGRTGNPDVDLVVVGDACQVAEMIYRAGLSDHAPVTYPRFGTARVQLHGVPVELVSARSESYDPASRKPSVRRATLAADIYRRDFTINTLVESLHRPGLQDITGLGLSDLRARLIRTPLDPASTFRDDPLRMLRAIRFAVTLDLTIEASTWQGILDQRHRIDLVSDTPRVVSAERVRDELIKIVMSDLAARGFDMLRETGLLERILPELTAMVGVTQNEWHAHDVWTHTMLAVSALDRSAPLSVRLGVLFHDVGKPATRTEDDRGIHFYDHQHVGAAMTHAALTRLRLPSDVIHTVMELVRLHMRLGEVTPQWSEAAMRRLIRDLGAHLGDLDRLARADIAAMQGRGEPTDLDAVMARIEATNAAMNVAAVRSPLTGKEIMEVLGIAPGPQVGKAKDHLVNEILEGRLAPDDAAGARDALRRWAVATEDHAQ